MANVGHSMARFSIKLTIFSLKEVHYNLQYTYASQPVF